MGDNILVVCAHPDDCELMFGGTISKYTSRGVKVNLIIVTDGSKWARCATENIEQLINIRENEALEASKILGVSNVEFMRFEDGKLEYDKLIDPLCNMIRKYNPSYIITHSEYENHTDHKIVSKVVKRLCNSFSEIMPISNVYWESEYDIACNFKELYTHACILQIKDENTKFMKVKDSDIEKKIEAVLCHKSQFVEERAEEISNKIFTEAKFYGNLVGIEFAESFCKITRREYCTFEFL